MSLIAKQDSDKVCEKSKEDVENQKNAIVT